MGAYLWEVAGAIADQQTCLSAATVADDDELLLEVDDGPAGKLLDLALAGRHIG